MSKKKAPSTGARPRCMTIESECARDHSPHSRPRARRRPGAPHGRRRQGAHRDRRHDHPAARARLHHPAMPPASSSMPMAIRRVSPTPTCRSLPTACPILPARSPASLPGSIGRRANSRRSQWLAERAGRLPVSAERPGGTPASSAHRMRTRRSPARARANGVIRSSRSGRSRCAKICGMRWSRKTCARSRSGPRGTASPSPTGRPNRSIRSSMSTRRRTRRAPKLLPRSIRTYLANEATRKTESRRSSPARLRSRLRQVRQGHRFRSARSRTPAPSCSILDRFDGAVGRRAQCDAHIFAPAFPLLVGECRRAPACATSGSGSAPASRNSSGRTTRTKVTKTATGFPGRPTKAAPSPPFPPGMTPIATGRPGFIATRQNTMRPMLSTASRT